MGTQGLGPQWTSQSEFGQDSSLTRNTEAHCKIERGQQIFTGIFFYLSQYFKVIYNLTAD